MNTLDELKVPPPLVALAVALAMWGVSTFTPTVAVPFLIRTIVAVDVALLRGVRPNPIFFGGRRQGALHAPFSLGVYAQTPDRQRRARPRLG